MYIKPKTNDPSIVETDIIKKYFQRSAGDLINSKIKTTLANLTAVFFKPLVQNLLILEKTMKYQLVPRLNMAPLRSNSSNIEYEKC